MSPPMLSMCWIDPLPSLAQTPPVPMLSPTARELCTQVRSALSSFTPFCVHLPLSKCKIFT